MRFRKIPPTANGPISDGPSRSSVRDAGTRESAPVDTRLSSRPAKGRRCRIEREAGLALSSRVVSHCGQSSPVRSDRTLLRYLLVTYLLVAYLLVTYLLGTVENVALRSRCCSSRTCSALADSAVAVFVDDDDFAVLDGDVDQRLHLVGAVVEFVRAGLLDHRDHVGHVRADAV